MFKILPLATALSATVFLASSAIAQHTGPFGFEPLTESATAASWNPAAPWKLPAGFSQTIVSDESSLDIYTLPTTGGNSNDWHDMNTVNETGKQAGRYLYRTHEVRGNAERGGVVTVVDLKTGVTSIIAEDSTYDALDGIRWTPWGTLLFAEEVTDGRLFEIILDKNDPTKGTVYDRPNVGRLAHEGIEVGPDGSIYMVDEFRGITSGYGGGVYKFVPYTYGDLTDGDLFVLAVDGDSLEGLGQGSWVGPIDPATARVSGTAAGGQSYMRPEDLEIIGDTLYVAITEGTPGVAGENYDGRVVSINLNSLQVRNYVIAPANVPKEVGTWGSRGFDNVDNLGSTPDGKLMMIEDNVPSDIWIADKDHDNDGLADNVWLFASLTDPGAEGTGIYFGKDPKTLFVNVQHSAADDGDATWAIRKE